MRKRRSRVRPLVGLRHTFLYRAFNNKPKTNTKDWKIKAYYKDSTSRTQWLEMDTEFIHSDVKIKSLQLPPSAPSCCEEAEACTSTSMTQRFLLTLALMVLLAPTTPVPSTTIQSLGTIQSPKVLSLPHIGKSKVPSHTHSCPYSCSRTLHGKKKRVKGMTLLVPIDPGEHLSHTMHRLW